MTIDYGVEADMWALGVIIYELLVGVHPFYTDGVTEADIRAKSERASNFDLSNHDWGATSESE